jgi:hypothetical protein
LINFTIEKSMAASPSSWKITQPVWNEQHETLFGEFVTRIATAVETRQCSSVLTCLKSPANMYFGSDPSGLRYYADCADFPYYLRAYFAWKNGLPFSFENQLAPQVTTSGATISDIRYTTDGNIVTGRSDIVTSSYVFKKSFPNAVEILNQTFSDYISTASYRMSGILERDKFSDFYPTRISRDAIRPGTVIYDTNGHVAIIYKVTDEGRIFYIDAHPDNSVTIGMFTPKFSRSRPEQGAGFKNFRPLILTDAQQDSDGTFVGGKIVGLTNGQLRTFGVEQFFGTNRDPVLWSNGTFVINNQTVDFYDYVRLKLTQGAQHLNPTEDLRNLVSDLCVSLKDRVAAVDAARSSGIQLHPHPDRLPMNIYGTSGEWEDFATPSRDARLKIAFADLLNQAKNSMRKYRSQDPALVYQGENLAKDLFQVYATEATACQFSYLTTSGKKVILNLESARQRLFNMSFDPYHCVELRWGARIPEEMASCTSDENKKQWYSREKWLRNQTERRYDVRMDFSLYDLTSPMKGAGVATPPDIDIVTYLRSEM